MASHLVWDQGIVSSILTTPTPGHTGLRDKQRPAGGGVYHRQSVTEFHPDGFLLFARPGPFAGDRRGGSIPPMPHWSIG